MIDPYKPITTSQTRDGVSVPAIIYGTAEKYEADIIFSALASGAVALDTACQPKYYNEEVVGHALRKAFQPKRDGGLGLARRDIYIQSKFTTPEGHRGSESPYLPDDPIPVMVSKSIHATLTKLQVQYVDALLLHAPMPTTEQTLEVWRAMEKLVGNEARTLGVCNVDMSLLEEIYSKAKVKPTIVQNRFWNANEYDRDIRAYCRTHGVIYQAFWILRANYSLLCSQLLGWLAEKAGILREEALFLSVLSLGNDKSGVSVLTGTRTPSRVLALLGVVSRLGALPTPLKQSFEYNLAEESIGTK